MKFYLGTFVAQCTVWTRLSSQWKGKQWTLSQDYRCSKTLGTRINICIVALVYKYLPQDFCLSKIVKSSNRPKIKWAPRGKSSGAQASILPRIILGNFSPKYTTLNDVNVHFEGGAVYILHNCSTNHLLSVSLL